MKKAALYFHTIRYLRPVQILGRVRFAIHKPRLDLRQAPALRVAAGKYVNPLHPEPSIVAEDVFRFLNVERRCAAHVDWTAPDVSRLWRYNLHYFDDLNATGSESRTTWHAKLLERWVLENPPGEADGWEPYPTSRRMINWIKWALRGNALSPLCRESLAVQTRWLTGRLEYHILGNHLLANAKALVYAGLFFGGLEAEDWLAQGLKILNAQLEEQILPDGGHFELSPMYHAAVLEDLLDLVNLFRAYAKETPPNWTAQAPRMLRWLQTMTHPDGEIAFFNDAAFAGAPNLVELRSYAERLGLPQANEPAESLTVLHASGYVRAMKGNACLVCDCAQVGPDYLPGHAHADTLSFELSIGAQRIFVNSGTSVYGTDSERQRQRGTAAHNTVTVDGYDSSEVWGGFRVARRARATLLAAESAPDAEFARIDASHDGYRRLRGGGEHRRRWTLGDGSLRIDDGLTGRFGHAEARFYLHPDVAVRSVERSKVELTWHTVGKMSVSCDPRTQVEITPATWHPKFGVTIATHCIAVRFAGNSLVTQMSWAAA